MSRAGRVTKTALQRLCHELSATAIKSQPVKAAPLLADTKQVLSLHATSLHSPRDQFVSLSSFCGPAGAFSQHSRAYAVEAQEPEKSHRRTKRLSRSKAPAKMIAQQLAVSKSNSSAVGTKDSRPLQKRGVQKGMPAPQQQEQQSVLASSKRDGTEQGQQTVSRAQPQPVSPASLSYEALKTAAQKISHKKDTDGLPVTKSALSKFQQSSEMKDKALALYVSATAFPGLFEQFEHFLLGAMTEDGEADLAGLKRSKRMALLFRLFAEYVVDCHSKELQAYRDIVNSMDLRKPHLWYPVARALKRRFVYHAGPTNSGKTFTALKGTYADYDQAMREASSGVYCGPLRLLAMEIYDELNAAGTFCNLVTGQEQRLLPTATHTACTIEMLNTFKPVEVAVIDEIQLLGDEQRGWAWTRALQGCPANVVHLCGDSSAVPLVCAIAAEMFEEIEIRNYERFSPVVIDEKGLANGFKDIEPGDCVIGFSRKSIYEIKSLIESITGLRTCVIYGALPPETRRQQARLFNEDDNEFSVMVASNAVGMGLNLNIRRIIFSTLDRFEGSQMKQISVSEIKQIAGRAGRRNSKWPVGYVTCMKPEEMPALRHALSVPLSEMTTPAAGLFAGFEHLEAYAGKSLAPNFVDILLHFKLEAKLDGTYFFCRQENMEAAAKLLEKVEGLSLQEKFWFCLAPINLREPRQAAALLHFATRFTAREPVQLQLTLPKKEPETPDELYQMEQMHQIVSSWLWLANRFEPASFPNREAAEDLSQTLIEQMHNSLQHMYTAQEGRGQRHHKGLTQKIKALKQPLLKDLSWNARQHFESESEMQVRSLVQRIASTAQSRGKGSSKALPQSMAKVAIPVAA